KAGLQKDDRILAIDGAPISSYEPLLTLRSRVRPGDTGRLDNEPHGRPVSLSLTAALLGRRPSMTSSWLPAAIGAAIEQLLTFYPLPFLIVAAAVLLQRPEDPRAWLPAAM